MNAAFEVEKVFFRLLYILKRLTDNWADSKFQEILTSFNTSYLPVLMCIDTNGTSNNEIAKELHISKMAVSKMVKELIRLELVRTRKDESDGRSDLLLLSPTGESFIQEVKQLSAGLIKEYQGILGKKSYDQMIDSMLSIQKYHERNAMKVVNAKLEKNQHSTNQPPIN